MALGPAEDMELWLTTSWDQHSSCWLGMSMVEKGRSLVERGWKWMPWMEVLISGSSVGDRSVIGRDVAWNESHRLDDAGEAGESSGLNLGPGFVLLPTRHDVQTGTGTKRNERTDEEKSGTGFISDFTLKIRLFIRSTCWSWKFKRSFDLVYCFSH